MIEFTRRNVVFTAAVAGTAFGLSKPIEIVSSALAQATTGSGLNPAGAKFHKFKIGDIEVTTVFDGAIFRDIARASSTMPRSTTSRRL